MRPVFQNISVFYDLFSLLLQTFKTLHKMTEPRYKTFLFSFFLFLVSLFFLIKGAKPFKLRLTHSMTVSPKVFIGVTFRSHRLLEGLFRKFTCLFHKSAGFRVNSLLIYKNFIKRRVLLTTGRLK